MILTVSTQLTWTKKGLQSECGHLFSGKDSHCTHCLCSHFIYSKGTYRRYMLLLTSYTKREKESERSRKDIEVPKSKLANVAAKTDNAKDERIKALEQHLFKRQTEI